MPRIRPFHAAESKPCRAGSGWHRSGAPAPCLHSAIGGWPSPRRSQRSARRRGRAAGIGIRQRRAAQLARAQMVVVLRIGVETGYHLTQAVITAELRTDRRDQVIPTLERLVVGISIQTIHSRLKLPPIDRFKQPSKNAIAKPHARSLSKSRQPESTCFMPGTPGMRCDRVKHSPDSPGPAGRGRIASAMRSIVRCDPGEGRGPARRNFREARTEATLPDLLRVRTRKRRRASRRSAFDAIDQPHAGRRRWRARCRPRPSACPRQKRRSCRAASRGLADRSARAWPAPGNSRSC